MQWSSYHGNGSNLKNAIIARKKLTLYSISTLLSEEGLGKEGGGGAENRVSPVREGVFVSESIAAERGMFKLQIRFEI